MNNIKMDAYIFTKEAYDEYNKIPSDLIDAFWRLFMQNKFIVRGGFVMSFMVEHISNLLEIKQDETVNGEFSHVDLSKVKDNIRRVFKNRTCVFYRNRKINIVYDLERASYIFSEYEKIMQDDDTFGKLWWKYHDEVVLKIYAKIIASK